MKTWKKVLDSSFDFKDRVNKSLGRETRDEWNKKELEKHYNHLKQLNNPDLDDIIDGVIEIWESGFYKELMLAFITKKDNSRFLTFDELYNNRLLVLAGENLPRKSLKTIAFSKTDLDVFKTMQPFIDTVYFMNLGREFLWEDALDTFFSGLDARLMLGLDRFDKLKSIPEPNSKFFRRLGETQIVDKETVNLYNKLTLLQMHIEDFIFGQNFGDFSEEYWPTESGFIQLLAGCSAVLNGRDVINSEDVIVAYKTFLKFIRTDVTVFKAPQSIIDSIPEFTSFLVCENCGNSYGLGPEESPEDYSDTCDCGGHLVYKEKL